MRSWVWDGVVPWDLSPKYIPQNLHSLLSDSEHLDTQKELLEEMYEEKLQILKDSLTSFYQEEIQVSCLETAPTNCSDFY
jgi:hypothetical protein